VLLPVELGREGHWRTLLDVTNAVVTKRDLGQLRAAIAPNVRTRRSREVSSVKPIKNMGRFSMSQLISRRQPCNRFDP
jgi:hypothetical protein